MSFVLKPTQDLSRAAKLTLENMSSYYQRFDVDWDELQVIESTKALENYDLFSESCFIGIARVEYTDSSCWLRDLQVRSECQSKGYGALAIEEVVKMARQRDLPQVELKVFKCSPAHSLYRRVGFSLGSEDDRFYYMVRSI
ncbi:MAG: GNAT family N-acetyltransferase [Gammaproteobacteria bacterium]|nr:GNAT family N-acetyltransferase [Gammaproteobacteria bacterium]